MDKDLKEAIALLVALEFPWNHTRCGICSGWMCSPNGETDFAHTKSCRLGKLLKKHAPDRPKKTYPRKGGAWVCNECGSHEFTGAVSEDDFEDDGKSCTSCGGTEFHWEGKL